MYRIGGLGRGVLLASIIAGPVFLLTIGAARLYRQVPQPILVDQNDLASLAGFLMLATPFGFVLALLPNAVGAGIMAALGDRFGWARLATIWALVGAAIGALAGRAFTSGQPEFLFAFSATSAICASFCRRAIDWELD